MKETQANMNFFVPIEFEKAQNKKGEKIMKIKGIASTADQDSDGEILEPIGFDLSRFLTTGFLNWNHQAKSTGKGGGAEAIVGEPTLAKITPKGELYIEGVLYNGHPLAESIWSLAETLERNGSKRKLGFSIEGRALERDIVNPKKITKALLTGVAVTHVPVNVNTYLDLCKGEQSNDFVEYGEESILEKSETSKYIFEFSCDGKSFGITKSFTVEEIEKDMNISNTAMLSPESLDKKVRVLEPNIKKAILGGIIPLKWVDRIEKGGSRAILGEIRKFGGRDMIKTAEGWKYHGKGTGAKAQEHKAGTTGSSEKKEESKTTPIEDIDAKIKKFNSPENVARLKTNAQRAAHNKVLKVLMDQKAGASSTEKKEETQNIQKISSLVDHDLSEENKQIILSELEAEPLECNKTQLKTISSLLSNVFANWNKDYPSTIRDFSVQSTSFDKETDSPYGGKMSGRFDMTLYKNSRDRLIVVNLPYKTANGTTFSTDLIRQDIEGSKGIENFLKKYPKLANQVKKSLIDTIGYNLQYATDPSNRNQRYSKDVLRSLGLYTAEATEVLKTLQE